VAAAPDLGSPVELSVEASDMAVDPGSVRQAILRELELQPGAAGQPAQVHVTLRVARDAGLTVTYRAGEAESVSRTVAAPGRADEVPEVTALLVGNLARDEASGLLSGLRQSQARAVSEPPAPALDRATQPTPRAALPLSPFNLSFFHPLSLVPDSPERRLAFELGILYSRVGELSGVGVSSVLLRVDGPASGVAIGGVGYWIEGPGAGLHVAGAFGVTRGDFDGISVNGVAALQRGELVGGSVAGALNVVTGAVQGAQVGGAVNLAGDLEGVQIGGAFNLARATQGVQVGGAVNIAQEDVSGVQLSGALNLAERLQGVQLSLINIGGDVDGAQLGLVNVAHDVRGVQLGLVNVANDVDGVSLGLVPYSSQGSTQAVFWYATTQPFNLGVRFHTGALYVMPTFGYDPGGGALTFDARGSYSPGFSLGARLPIDALFVDLEANYSNRSDGATYDEQSIDLRYRALLGYQLLPKLGVFVGGGVRHHFRTEGPSEESVDPELSLGVQVL
jgi:hypothetical protein